MFPLLDSGWSSTELKSASSVFSPASLNMKCDRNKTHTHTHTPTGWDVRDYYSQGVGKQILYMSSVALDEICQLWEINPGDVTLMSSGDLSFFPSSFSFIPGNTKHDEGNFADRVENGLFEDTTKVHYGNFRIALDRVWVYWVIVFFLISVSNVKNLTVKVHFVTLQTRKCKETK